MVNLCRICANPTCVRTQGDWGEDETTSRYRGVSSAAKSTKQGWALESGLDKPLRHNMYFNEWHTSAPYLYNWHLIALGPDHFGNGVSYSNTCSSWNVCRIIIPTYIETHPCHTPNNILCLTSYESVPGSPCCCAHLMFHYTHIKQSFPW